MFKNPFSIQGRIRRTEYGVSFIIFIIARTVITLIAASMSTNSYDNSGAVAISLLFSLPLLWFLWAQGAKRCHDVGNNGWWQIIPFYMFWLIFQDSQAGPNQYGENPKGIQAIGGITYQGGQYTSKTEIGYQGGYSGGHNSPNTNYSATENPAKTEDYKDGDLYK